MRKTCACCQNQNLGKVWNDNVDILEAWQMKITLKWKILDHYNVNLIYVGYIGGHCIYAHNNVWSSQRIYDLHVKHFVVGSM